MIDSHVHLNLDAFKEDFDDVLDRAKKAGVTHMVNIGFDLDSSHETLLLTRQYPFLYGAVGVHPHDATTYDDDVERALGDLLEEPRVIAVGEIGLDYYRDLSPRKMQKEVFKSQLRLARTRNKPVIIHCRDAFDDVIDVLTEEGGSYRGIFHAFSGDESMAGRVLELGFHIGIGGVVTFRNSRLSEVVAGLPVESIVLETDCPYLTPMPFRGKRNEPAYLTYVVDKISETTGESADVVGRRTDRNFFDAMGLAA